MKDMIFCQSCAMPLMNDKDYGTNKDGSKNKEYCEFCYEDGEFKHDCTMEEMIEVCADYSDQWEPKVTREEAIIQMKQFFPTLKRWKNS